ncbi:hypothetical protein D3C81_1455850 [compost metagenome]
MFEAGEARCAGLAGGPVGVAEGEVAGAEARPGHPGPPAVLFLPAMPDHLQIAIDGERAAEGGGNLFIDQRADAVPVEYRHEDQRRYQQGEQGR